MRFNTQETSQKKIQRNPNLTQNKEGGIAFKVTPEMELYLRACVGLFEDTFYQSGNESLAELQQLVKKNDRQFILQLANFVRNEMYLRSLPVMLLAEVSRMPLSEGEPEGLLRAYVPKICTRADQPAELLSYLKNHILSGSKKKLPMAIRKGLSDALNQFDEYQLQKWDMKGKEFKLKDVVKIVHPKPKDKAQSALYQKILKDELQTAETWETYISVYGASRETWEYIVDKMGIMAVLRNLRNFEKHQAEGAISKAIKMLKDPEVIQRSKQLPFRWLSALNAVNTTAVKDAIREAIELSVANIPRWDGTTAVFVDLSGSMSSKMSQRSEMTRREVASVMGALALHLSQEDYLVGAFGQRYEDIELSRKDSVLTNTDKIVKTDVGHSTNAYLCLEDLIRWKRSFDRIFIFSDMQCYDDKVSRTWAWAGGKSLSEYWKEYRNKINRDAVMYSVDLAGHGTAQFPQDESNVVQISGWSDKIFQFVDAYENRYSIVEKIKGSY